MYALIACGAFAAFYLSDSEWKKVLWGAAAVVCLIAATRDEGKYACAPTRRDPKLEPSLEWCNELYTGTGSGTATWSAQRKEYAYRISHVYRELRGNPDALGGMCIQCEAGCAWWQIEAIDETVAANDVDSAAVSDAQVDESKRELVVRITALEGIAAARRMARLQERPRGDIDRLLAAREAAEYEAEQSAERFEDQ